MAEAGERLTEIVADSQRCERGLHLCEVQALGESLSQQRLECQDAAGVEARQGDSASALGPLPVEVPTGRRPHRLKARP